MSFVDLSDFEKLDIRIGKIIKAEQIPGSKKLLKLEIDIGGEVRRVVAGIAEYYRPEDLVNRKVVILTNLKPKKIFGVESQGMILAADVNGKPYLLTVDKEVEVPEGSKVR